MEGGGGEAETSRGSWERREESQTLEFTEKGGEEIQREQEGEAEVLSP